MKRILLIALILSSCASVPPLAPKEPTQEQGKPYPTSGWQYDSLVASKTTPAMLKANVGAFCPNYSKVDHAVFWQKFVAAIAYAESAWKPECTYTETAMGTDPVTGKQIVSEGLMQLSYVDSRNWSSLPGCKAIDYAKKNIRNPEINLTCALEITNRLIEKNPGVDISDRKSLGAYWSSARVGHDASRKKLKAIFPECF